MDKKYSRFPGDPLVVTGLGLEASPLLTEGASGGKSLNDKFTLEHDCNPKAFLKQRKTIKFMSKQDRLGVNAAGQAIAAAGLGVEELSRDSGLFLTVGYIPFDIGVATELCANSVEDGKFSMERFSTDGIDNINPLLAFACLPNMPAHHIATNFSIHGEYQITYPDLLQFYIGLEEAISSLSNERVDYAIVGGIADQNNFLVRHHFVKTAPSLAGSLADAATFMVLERESTAQKRNAAIVARLDDFQLCSSGSLSPQPSLEDNDVYCGPAQLPLELSRFVNSGLATYTHSLSRWGNQSSSTWVKP